MAGVTYDTGALVAAERNYRRMWALANTLAASAPQMGNLDRRELLEVSDWH